MNRERQRPRKGRKTRTAGGARRGEPARDSAARKEVAHAIGAARRAGDAGTLVTLLDDRDPHVVTTALWALGRVRAAGCLTPIAARLEDANDEIARAAIWAAGQLGTPEAAAALAAHLLAAPTSRLKPLLVALDHLPRPQAIEAVERLLHQADGPGRSRLSQALVRWDGAAAAAIRAHLALAAPATESGEPGRPPCPPACRRACAYILAATAATPEDTAVLVDLAGDADPRTRLHAVSGLARAGGPETWPALARLLDDERHDVQRAALRALRRIEATAALDASQDATVAAALRRVAADVQPDVPERSAQSGPQGVGAIRDAQEVRGSAAGPEPPQAAQAAQPALLPAAELPLGTRLLIAVVPGLEGIGAAEVAAACGEVPTAVARGYLAVSWAGPLATLAGLRTVHDVLLDAGPAPEPGDLADTAALSAALDAYTHLTPRQRRPATAYVSVPARATARDDLRAAARAALDRLDVATAPLPPGERADVTVAVLPWGGAGGPAPGRLRLGIPLFPRPLGRRPLPGGAVAASLNATVAAAMVRLLEPAGGEVFLDPMCGAGTLLRERLAVAPAPALLLGGDLDLAAVERARANLPGSQARLAAWDATALPLDAASVDAVACNLPYGRRAGTHVCNLALYPAALGEMHRVLRARGHAALLTQEKNLFRASLGERGWRLRGAWTVEIGGLVPTLYLVERP